MSVAQNPPYIVFPDDFSGYDPRYFCIPKCYEDALECVLIPNGFVRDRIERLARDIVKDMGSEKISSLCVLKGGYKFYTDLIDQIKMFNHYTKESTVHISVEFIQLKSYQDDKSSDNLQVMGIENLDDLAGKNILVVEDLIDTGKTIKKLLDLLKAHNVKSTKVASLLLKRTKMLSYIPDYCGFEVPDKFIVGYAIDYNEHFRDLDHVCAINEYGKKKFGSSSYKPLTM